MEIRRNSSRYNFTPTPGLCYRDEGGVLRLLHGSTTRKAVILDEDLATYLTSVPTHSGIMVARPLEVT